MYTSFPYYHFTLIPCFFRFCFIKRGPDIGLIRNFQIHSTGCLLFPPYKSHLLIIHIYTKYFSCRQTYQKFICTILSLSRFASSRYTELDASLIKNLQVNSINCSLSAPTTIFVSKFIHQFKPTLGIFFFPKIFEWDNTQLRASNCTGNVSQPYYICGSRGVQ